jgi:hypothetical protein
MACNIHLMVAPWDDLVNKHGATNGAIVLILPTGKILHQMSALEHPVSFEDINHATIRALITTSLWTWVCAPFA